MATKLEGKPVRTARGWALALLALLATSGARAQDAPNPPQRPREVLKAGIDSYKRGEYEAAATLFTQAQAREPELSATEKQDLASYSLQNSSAMRGRQEGSNLLRLADEAVQQGRPADAGNLLKAANANQYLSTADRQHLTELNRQVQVATAGPADARALVTAARTALQKGDLDTADRLAAQAEQAGSGVPAWLKPWEDSPSRVRRDVATARQKVAPPRPAETAAKESTSIFSGVKNLFNRGSETPAAPAPEQAKVNPAPASDSAAAARAQARQLLREGYRAVEANDLERARRFAIQARDLHAELDRNELGPDQLLHEIQRRSAAATPAPAGERPPDSRALVAQARQLMQKGRLDEAESVLNQAAAVPFTKWRLFEDTPDTARRDLLKARAQREREESGKLLVEARRLYGQGNLEQAKLKAWQAQKLHGPYGYFDFSDRPQRLLDDITRAEAKLQKRIPGKDDTAVAQNKTPAPEVKGGTPGGLVSATAQNETHNRAAELVREARALQRQGKLLEALQKASEARQMQVAFAPGDDSPGAVLQDLAGDSNRQVQQLVQQAVDKVIISGGDPGRLLTARLELDQARRLAQSFGLDTQLIDQKAVWVQQLAAANGGGDPAVAATAPAGPHQTASLDPQAQAQRQAGAEKLDKARLELRAGNYALARKLAEEALDPVHGVQSEAEAVLRSISAEEHGQRLLAARRTFDAVVDAFTRGDYPQAMSIIAALDAQLLAPDAQARLREIMAAREMQPGLLPVGHQEKTGALAQLKEAPGKAQAADSGNTDYLNSVRAMEEVQFQQLRERGLQAQRLAMDYFKAGQESQAVDTLNEYLKQLEGTQLDLEKLTLLKRPVENRLQQYRTVQAQRLLLDEKNKMQKSPAYKENQRQMAQQKAQEDIADMLKQYNQLMKEGKEKEAWALATKASELDPENTAVRFAVETAKIKFRQKDFERDTAENEKHFLYDLNPKMGPFPSTDEPIVMSKEAVERYKKRGYDKNGIWSQQRTQTEKAIENKLYERVSLNFKEMPLGQALEDVMKMTGLNIVPNTRALHENGISLDVPVTLSVNDIPLKSALNLLLGKVKLTYAIKENVLSITTEDDGKGKLRTVVYPVADLVIPVQDHPLPDVYNIEKVLEQHMPNRGVANIAPSPITGPMSMGSGLPVSAASSGLGTSGPGSSGSSGWQTGKGSRIASGTIEEHLMGLIKNTVAKNTWEELGGQGTIQYFPLGMALVINQTQEAQEEIAALLAALRRLQDLEVAIEMRLVSVSESFFEFMGVNFDVNLNTPTSRREPDLITSNFVLQPFVNRNLNNIGAVTGLTPANTLTPDLNIPIKNTSFGFSTPPFGGYPGTFGSDGGLSLGLAFLSEIQVFMFMEAAQGDRRTQIMQAPKITVFNGQTATIAVTENRFFLTGVNIFSVNGQLVFSPSNSILPAQSIAMVVTPVISADRRFVRLNMTPTLTNPTNTLVPLVPVQIPVPQIVQGPGQGVTAVGAPSIFQMFFQQPSTQTIAISTTVNVPDGGTVLLGGLKTMSEGRNEFGPPLISKVPYLNRLFKNVGYGREAQSLMIMVTPRIIINEEEEQIFLGGASIPRP